MTNPKPFLDVANVSKSFAGVQALHDVSMTIYPGKITCLVGENGSGKSTLIKTIAGVHQPTSGTITIDGEQYPRLRPIDAIRAGIQVIYQDFSLFPNLTVAENLAINAQLDAGRRFVNWGTIHQTAREALARTEVDIPLNVLVETLSVAEKQLIAISRAMLQNAQLIIMDEPTTALTEKEVSTLFEVIEPLQAQGISILFVSHKLNEVLAIADKIVVLRNGEKVLDTDVGDMDQSQIAYHMTGQEFDPQPYTFTPAADASPLLSVQNLARTGKFDDVSFDLYAGEILGITGLLGSGRTDLALALFGVQPASSGTLMIDGQAAEINSIQDAIDQQIGYVPEDRLTEGLFLERSIGNNIVVRTVQELLNAIGLIDGQEKQSQIQRWVSDLSIKTNDPQLPANSLSGGNQQRVVIAKWLASNPRILILNGPTVGVDIGSKTELHDIIKDLAQDGMGLIVISDDIPELMQTCNRILLMRDGQVVNEYQTSELTESKLSALLSEAAETLL